MKKTIALISLITLLPIAARADESVVITRKNCYAAILKIFCKGDVKNVSERDLDNVIIRFSSPYLKLHAPQVNTDVYDQIDHLPAGETANFVVVWDTLPTEKKIDPDILREYILTSINNGTMETSIILAHPEKTQPEK